jgi:hypothetical protein
MASLHSERERAPNVLASRRPAQCHPARRRCSAELGDTVVNLYLRTPRLLNLGEGIALRPCASSERTRDASC